MYGYESWTIKKAENQRIDALELWCWRRLLRVPWTARRTNQSVLKEINPKCSLETETPILWPPDVKNWLTGKDPDAGKDWRWENGTTEDEMVGWHHRLDGHEFEQAQGVGNGQGSLVCCSPWGCKELDMTEWLNSNNSNFKEINSGLRYFLGLWVSNTWGGEATWEGTKSKRIQLDQDLWLMRSVSPAENELCSLC